MREKMDVLYNFNHGSAAVLVGVRDWMARRMKHHENSRTLVPFALRPIADLVISKQDKQLREKLGL